MKLMLEYDSVKNKVAHEYKMGEKAESGSVVLWLINKICYSPKVQWLN